MSKCWAPTLNACDTLGSGGSWMANLVEMESSNQQTLCLVKTLFQKQKQQQKQWLRKMSSIYLWPLHTHVYMYSAFTHTWTYSLPTHTSKKMNGLSNRLSRRERSLCQCNLRAGKRILDDGVRGLYCVRTWGFSFFIFKTPLYKTCK